jgi:endonuclease/exonuclease/phosphatase family metal-dependent hydrolase
VILGDTNIWSRGRKFLFKNDSRAYKVFCQNLVDFSANIISTSYLGFGLDKVFGSKNLKISNVESPKIRSIFMDHYPVIIDLEK